MNTLLQATIGILREANADANSHDTDEFKRDLACLARYIITRTLSNCLSPTGFLYRILYDLSAHLEELLLQKAKRVLSFIFFISIRCQQLEAFETRIDEAIKIFVVSMYIIYHSRLFMRR